MRGLWFDAVGHVSYRTDLVDPEVEQATDAIVAVSHAGLCGSDLHPYEGREPARTGVVPGHEAVGEVAAIGHEVRRFGVGDRVVVPFTTSCADCLPCRSGLSARCQRGSLFGWGRPDEPAAAALNGAQAEYVRVPLADGTLVAIPAEVDAATALLLSDNLPTAWEAVERAAPVAGQPLVVVGLGSVGLCAVLSARHAGAGPLIGIDPVRERRDRATHLGADLVVAPDGAVEAVSTWLTADPELRSGDPRAPAVVEAAGTTAAQRIAFELLRPGGTLSIISVQTAGGFAFTPVEAYDRNVTVRTGRASVRSTLEELLPRVLDGRPASPASDIVTHLDVPLDEGPALYRRFAARAEGLIKAGFAM